MDFDKLITLTVEENEKCKTEILRHKTKMVEKPTCAICSINTANCDCDKCGVWGCYDCVANKNDEYNICDKCDCEEEIEEFNSDKLDNILYPDGLDWTFEKPTKGKYHTIYIKNRYIKVGI